jgi:hypothetical protein
MDINTPSHERTLSRLKTCAFTIRTTLAELEDPQDIERRADLLLASEDLLNDVILLNNSLRDIVWNQLDRESHPSNTKE